jgi:hypothetical protein
MYKPTKAGWIFLAAFAGLFALSRAWAQPFPPQTIPPYVTCTTVALNLFVNGATGNDGNTCRASGTPCKTTAGAFRKVPHCIKHPVTITFAAGNYDGAWLENYYVDRSVTQATGAAVTVVGTLVNATASFGTSSGTVASSTAATFTTSTYNTITKTAAGWSTDDFRGKLLTFSTGVLAGKSYPIITNSGTVLTVGGDFIADGGAPGVGSAFQIKDYATKFTGAGFSQPPSPVGWFSAFNTFGWYVTNFGPDVDALTFKNVWFKSDALTNFYTGQNTSVTFYYSKFSNTGAFNTLVSLGANTQINSIGTTYILDTSQVGLLTSSEPFYLVGYSLPARINSQGDVAYGIGVGSKLGLFYEGTGFTAKFDALYVNNVDRAFYVSSSTLLFNSVIINTVNYGIGANFASAGFASVDVYKGYFTSCSVTAIAMDGRGSLVFDDTEGGATNGVGITATNGALVKILSTTNIGATNELQVDGSNFSLATLRAATPKTETSTLTGSRIYQ